LASTWLNLHQPCELRHVPAPYRFRSEVISANWADGRLEFFPAVI